PSRVRWGHRGLGFAGRRRADLGGGSQHAAAAVPVFSGLPDERRPGPGHRRPGLGGHPRRAASTGGRRRAALPGGFRRAAGRARGRPPVPAARRGGFGPGRVVRGLRRSRVRSPELQHGPEPALRCGAPGAATGGRAGRRRRPLTLMASSATPPAATPLAATAQQLNALSPYIRYGAEPPSGEGWYPLTRL